QVAESTVTAAEGAMNGLKTLNDDLKAGNSGLVLVFVKTLSGANQQPIPGLRVSYHADWDSTSSEFHNVTSPASETLVIGAIYVLSVPKSDQLKITVSRAQANDNVLVVK